MRKSKYEECFSEAALELSWERVLSSVGADAKDFFGISLFKKGTSNKLEALSELLLSGEYVPKRPFKYFEPKKSATQRTKTVLGIEDALVYQAICNHVAELEYFKLKETSQCVFGSVLNENVAKGVKLLEDDEIDDYYFFEFYVEPYNRFINSVNKTLESGNVEYILETDITGFFDTIPHSIIIGELINRDIDSQILELLSKCLNIWSGTRDAPTFGVGIPQGPAGSFLISNIVLDSIDRIAIADGLHYFRFVDDIRIYGKSRKELVDCLVLIDRHLKSKSLCLNSEKTNIQLLKEYEDFKEKELDDYGIRVDRDKVEQISQEALDQNITQFGETDTDLKELSTDEYLGLYYGALTSYQIELKKFYIKHKNKDLWTISSSDMREFLTYAQRWRTIVKVLKDEDLFEPDKSMIKIWLFGIRAFFWKTNNFVWNLQLYDNLSKYYSKIFVLFNEFNSYEWIQYQILSIFKDSNYLSIEEKQKFLKFIPNTKSPLVRLGYFKILLHTIKSDTKFFQSVAERIKMEEDSYVKNSILNSINRRELKVSVDTLKTWFL